MTVNTEVGGFSGPKKVGEATKTISVAIVRFKSDGQLDVIVSGNGTLTTLQLIKQVGETLATLTPSEPLESGWDELVKIPGDGTEVKVAFAIRTEYVE